MSVHVTSCTRSFPLSHGTSVIPSGRLPSDRLIPEGSSREGILAEENARCIYSVVERTVTKVSALTPATTQTMQSELVYITSTMLAGLGVWSAEGRAESEASGNSHCVVIHAQANG